MAHTIEDMEYAYVFLNDAMFNGVLLGLTGEKRVTIEIKRMPGKLASTARKDYGFAIYFDEETFGSDLCKDLLSLFHEMMHVYIYWGDPNVHGGAWADGMTMHGVETDGVHERVIPGGRFERYRDEWIRQRGALTPAHTGGVRRISDRPREVKPASNVIELSGEAREWLVVPACAGGEIASAVSPSFTRIIDDIERSGRFLNEYLLIQIERLEEKIINRACDKATEWAKYRADTINKYDYPIISECLFTKEEAMSEILELMESSFKETAQAIEKFRLINKENPDELVFSLDYQYIATEASVSLGKMIGEWK